MIPSATTVKAASAIACPADALLGIAWWNGLTKAQRAYWLDRAWRRASPRYTVESMPSAADAWEQFKAGEVQPS